MIADIFQTLPIPADNLQGSYDLGLVVLSILTAISASYIALDLTGRIRDVSNTARATMLWLVGGAIAMGSGIWAMHFIGMLSFSIPGLSLHYNLFWTAFSLLVAIMASAFALYLLKLNVLRLELYIAGGVVLGLAIASMHYSGMEAMLISLRIRYLPGLFFISILIAIVASEAALWLALKSNQVILRLRNRIKLISAIIMGIAICGMHYTGMAASVFTPLCATDVTPLGGSLDPSYLGVGVAAITFVILAIAFLTSNYKENLNQEQFEKSRQLVMAEISASVLHNVGNVLNSVNVSANLVGEKIANSKLSGLTKLAALFNDNKDNMVEFFQDSRGAKALEYMTMLSKQWHDEQIEVSNEMIRINKNLSLIKEIISTQQELSRTSGYDQIISINELLEEAILISGLYLKKDITLVKDFGKINSITTDKVKLLQVFVNLLRNAKDAVMESAMPNKVMTITIKTYVINENRVGIEVKDNGVGVDDKNKNKIFSYGFTTKKTGHGFGLHTSALAINAIGGTIQITSLGTGKGATVIIELPCTKSKKTKELNK
jgi:NO-binding membrane sensor protein with MHYT domain